MNPSEGVLVFVLFLLATTGWLGAILQDRERVKSDKALREAMARIQQMREEAKVLNRTLFQLYAQAEDLKKFAPSSYWQSKPILPLYTEDSSGIRNCEERTPNR